MKRNYSLFIGLFSLACMVALTGCATNAVFPDPGAATVQSDLGSIHGSNYGGHAPIVGAHLFVLQAGTGGYGTASKSLLTASYPSTGPSSIYPTALDNTSGSLTQGDYYVVTDSTGSFNISGDYTCTAGLPVYVYASGGTSALQPYTNIVNATYTVTGGGTVAFTGVPNLLSVGQSVTFSSMTALGLVTLGAGTYKVTAADLTHFTVTGTLALNGTSGTTSGIVTPVLINNPAIVNMAVLGNCPSTGAANFSNLSYVYLNEVSTVAAAYALSGYFSNSATSLMSTDALHLAIPLENGNSTTSPAWVGIQNAVRNAALLYNIQGNGPIGTSGDGENHGANNVTASGGIVPAALINSIANALASCVDSGNTATGPGLNGPTAPCTTLFGYALPTPNGTGGVTGTAPKDTATVAINLAHNPWNSNSTNILNLATGVVPYLPTTSSATDLALVMSYPIAHQSGQFGGIAIDASGDAWATSFNDPALTKLSPQGVVLATNTFPSGRTPGDVAFDSKGNAWVAIRDFPTPIQYYGTYEFTNAGTLVAGSPFATSFGTNAYTFALGDDIQVAVDANDFIYFTNHPFNNTLELDQTGAAVNSYANNTYTNDGPYGVAFDKNNNMWMSSNLTTNSVVQFQNGSTGGSNSNPLRYSTNIPNPEAFAIDATGNIWVSDALDGATTHNDIYKISNIYGAAGNYTATRIQGGGAENTVGMAVDGAGLVFAASVTGGASNIGSLAVFNNAATALTGGNGINGQFTVSGGSAVVPINGPYFIAIDASGNVWAQTNTTVVEYIGAATPVLTPLSAAVKAGTIAVRP